MHTAYIEHDARSMSWQCLVRLQLSESVLRSTERQRMLWSLPWWTRAKRSSSSSGFVLAESFNLTEKCVGAIRQYGDVCYPIFVSVVSNSEAYEAIRSIGPTCNENWMKCFTNLNGSGGKLDAILRLLEGRFAELCDHGCWKKTFDIVEHCAKDSDTYTKQVTSLG